MPPSNPPAAQAQAGFGSSDSVLSGVLRRVEHVLSSKTFEAVLAGKRLARSEHWVWHAALGVEPVADALEQIVQAKTQNQNPAQTARTRVGVILPKRFAKRSATRNLLRRQVYALALDSQHQWPPGDHVFRLHKPFAKPGFVSAQSDALKFAVRDELHTMLGRVQTQRAKPVE